MSNELTLIKELRARTGVGVNDAKNALMKANGDLEKAVEIVRKEGGLKAEKKGARVTREGLIHAYIHSNGKIGAMVEVNCETDFVARNKDFQTFVNDIAMQVTATDPKYLSRDEVPEGVIAKETELIREQLREEGKSDTIIEKALPGALEKFFELHCLLEQPFIKDETMTVRDLISSKVSQFGENIKVNRFIRFGL